jgi:hypothetical protein
MGYIKHRRMKGNVTVGRQWEAAVITNTIHEISSVTIVYRREKGLTVSPQQHENLGKDAEWLQWRIPCATCFAVNLKTAKYIVQKWQILNTVCRTAICSSAFLNSFLLLCVIFSNLLVSSWSWPSSWVFCFQFHVHTFFLDSIFIFS